MENTYKNLCGFPIPIKSIGETVPINGTFECEDNDEMKDLVKQNKVANYGKDAKSTKKGRKKKQPSEPEDNSEQEDNKTNERGAF